MPNSSSMALTASTTSSTLHSLSASTKSFGVIFVVAIYLISIQSVRSSLLGRRGGRVPARAFELVPVRLQQADQLLDRGLDRGHQLRDGTLEGAEQLRQQHLPRGQVGDPPDFIRT